MSFLERKIDLTFKLASGSFDETGTSENSVTGLRVTTKLLKAGGPSMGTAQIEVYGMTMSFMNKLSTLGMRLSNVPRNTVTVSAGDDTSGMGVVFIGTITYAWIDFAASPEVPFRIDAHTLGAEAVIQAKPSSFKGSTDVATVLSGLAQQMGLQFENNGVTSKLSNTYLAGSARSQALAVVQHAGISWNGGDNGILAIWPKNKSRTGGQIPRVAADTGLQGYPSFTANGIHLTTLFNPSIQFGSMIQVETDPRLASANGTWAVYELTHDLEAQVINGRWHSDLSAYNPKFPPPIPS